MFLNKVELQNFRNYEKQTISFKSGINILVGKNGSGKTNILESIYYLAITHSHRTHDDSLLINNKNEFFGFAKRYLGLHRKACKQNK